MERLDVQQLAHLLTAVADAICANRDFLCEEDGKIGDGDHGFTMYSGFDALRSALAQPDFPTANALFAAAGQTLMNNMGGASGIVFSSLFSGGAKALPPDTRELDLAAIASFFEAGQAAIMKRGKAAPGDKTMLDALYPAVDSLRQSADRAATLSEAFAAAATAAEQGATATRDMIARHGRAKSLGERALGHRDPGAVSVQILFAAIRDWIALQ